MSAETTELAVTSTTTLLSLVGDKYKAEIAGHVEALKKITEVKDDSDARTANAAVKAAKTVIDIIAHKDKGKRIAVCRVLKKIEKAINAEAEELTGDASKEVERVKKLIAEHAETEIRKQREEEERKQREAAEAAARELAEREAKEKAAREAAAAFGDNPDETAPAQEPETPAQPEVVEPEVVEPVKPKPVIAGVTVRRVYTFKIVDPDAVPREYCKPDETLIRKFMDNAKANGLDADDIQLAGVEFSEEVRV